MNLGKQKRYFIAVLLMTLLFSLIIIKPSDAQYDLGVKMFDAPKSSGFSDALMSAPTPGIVVTETTAAKKTVMQKIGGAVASAMWEGVGFALDNITYQTAVWLASGGGGQKPLWLASAGFGQLVDGAVGESIYALGNNIDFLKKYGISLCVPPDLKLQLWLQLNLAEQWQPAAPHCSFKQIKEAWGRIDEPNYWKGVGAGFRPGQNDLSMLLAADQAVKVTSLRKKEEAKEELDYRGQAVTPNNVAGQAKVPVTFIEKLAQDLAKPGQEVTIAKTQSTADALNAGDWTGALLNVGRIFTNTLANKLLSKAMTKGFLSVADLFGSSSEKAVSAEGQIVGGRQAAEIAFAEFLKPNLPSVEQWNYTGELSADCSANPSPYCGVMDNSLQTALAQADSGGAVTVKEALAKGFLHGDWFLLPPNSDCPREAYCYENLVKLRQLRILPIGWELAAKASKSDAPTSLQKAIDSFSTPVPIQGVKNDFYHLIDPYWILKAPVAKCGAMAFSSNFLMQPAADGTGGQRGEYCADVQNCVQEDESGQCNQGSWGYCLKEKNRWILGGDSCDEQFNTCTTYANSKGQTASYLANTIEKSICNADNVGCRAYAVSSNFNNDKLEWNTAQSADKIYFNAKATQCDYSNEGCSQFVRTGFGLIGGAEVSNEKVNLKKAPEYYNCYGEMRASAPIPWEFSSSTFPTWAVNKADLSKIFDSWKPQNKEKCGNFAQVCSYDEVGCEKYTPINGDLPIPGILTANDQCPSACVGYESFKQQNTNFETAPTELAYFIPSTAVSCQESEAGCDEFVNLEAQTVGGEGKEYYTELRQCSQNETDGAVYYTWEGSDTAGYQLKSFNLKKGTAGAGEIGNPPAYNTIDAVKLTEYQTNCNSDLYKNKTADPDCREFYDKDGNKSYRLYTKTITVSAIDCKKLRKSVSDESSCNSTSGSWEPNQKICTYLAIPKEGQSCKAAVVGCRAYKGNAGNNFYPLPNFPITFENGAVGSDAQQSTGWAGKFSAESTVVGGKSLKVSNGHTEITTSLAKGATYSLSFWAKGLGDGLDVSIKPTNSQGQPLTPPVTTIIPPFSLALHADWQNYTVGPIVIDWDESAASSTVRFESVPSKVFYLDNIVAKQMNANIYVVKNSWKTPSACDNLIGDEYGQSQGGSFTNPYRLVPQAMLGCQKYTDRQNQEVAVKSFTSMCREEAVGCEEFVDTHNTASSEAKIYNAFCQLPITATDRVNKTDKAEDCKDDKDNVLCQVEPSQDGCYFTAVKELPIAKVNYLINTDEKIDVPADNKVYLVNDKNYYCANDALGCSALGAVNYSALNNAQAPGTAYLKNQPDIYGQILCEQKAEGCEEFKTTQGAAYFKDPQINNAFCNYKENFPDLTIVGDTKTGWVRNGLGLCAVTEDLNGFSIGNGTFCSSDQDCDVKMNKKCLFKDRLPCIINNNFVVNIFANYLLPKNGDTDYNGAVGLCPSEQNGCSEFIDPMDTTPIHTSGTPYFVINNSKLDRATCGNQASLQEGCVLFNETSKGTLNWSASTTYQQSEAVALNNQNKSNKVNPVDCGADGKKGDPNPPAGCDANSTDDKNTVNTLLKVQRDRVCGEWLACKSSMSVRDDNATGGWKEMCTELAPCSEANSQATTLTGKCGKWASGEKQVTKDTYKARGVTWWDPEYSGYTLPNAYQIQTLSVADKNLGYNTNTGVFTEKPAPTTSLPQSCRGYAQSDMPDKFSDGSTGACSYIKVTYSAQNIESITQYWPYNQLLGAEGVCSGGFSELGESKKGLSCVHSGNCTDDRPLNPAESAFAIKEHGVCMLQKQISKSRGWEGYCLDPAALNTAATAATGSGASSGNDIASGAKQSQPKNCTLWYPLTTPSGSVSSDHLYASAGYVPPSGSGKYWCVQAKGNANTANTTTTFSYAYTAYKDARQFYPHTAEGYNGKSCSSGDQYYYINYDGQAKATCPGIKNPYPVFSYYDNKGEPVYKTSFSDYTLTNKVGSELITDYDKDKTKEPLYISEVTAISLVPTGDYYGKDDGYYDDTWPINPLYVFRDQRLAGIENIKQEERDGRYWSGPLKKFGNYWVMDLTWTMKTSGQTEEINYDAITEAVCAKKLAVGLDAAMMGFRAYFNANGKLEKIGTKICDAGSSATGMQMDLVFYLSEVCTDIRQVVDTDSPEAINSPMGFLAKGRTDRLWKDRSLSQSPYKVGADLKEKNQTLLDLSYDQLFAPFGSFSQSRNPVTTTLSVYTDKYKSSYAQRNALNQAGFWPIWTMPGGGTPLSCAKDGKGDCGQVALCQSGPQKGIVCDPNEDTNGNGIPGDDPGYPGVCEWHPLATCGLSGAKKCSSDSSKSDMAGQTCTSNPDCQKPSGGTGACIEIKVCSDGPKKDQECGPPFETDSLGKNKEEHNGGDWCNELGINEYFSSSPDFSKPPQFNSADVKPDDCLDCKIKLDKSKDEWSSYVAYKCNFSNTRGLCVGGLNHGQFCGGNLDCPPKKHSDSTEDTVEYGVCVGAALDEGKVIPKNDTTGNGFGLGFERLLELFPAWFNTWEWKDNHYSEYLPGIKENKGQTNEYNTFKNQWDYTYGNAVKFDASDTCSDYPNASCNSQANVWPSPPKIYSLKLKDASKPDSGYTWGKANAFTVNDTDSDPVQLSSSASTAILRFFAYADNDQMPIVRIAIDWGDEGDPYVIGGWFKNRKAYCQVINQTSKMFSYCSESVNLNKPNRPCQEDNDCKEANNASPTCVIDNVNLNRLYFGNSSSACEEGFYQFTHIYECPGKVTVKVPACSASVTANCWEATAKSCKFTPKVQVLDNWGWCNSSDGNGKWNDNDEDETLKNCRTANNNVGIGKNNPWTSFGGTIEVKP